MSVVPTSPRSLLPPRVLWWGVVVAMGALFVLRLTYFLFQDLVDGRPGHVPERFFTEATGNVLALIPLGALAWLARRVPLVPPLRPRTIAIYGGAFVVLSTVHTAAMVAVRAALAPTFGLDGYGYVFSAARFGYEGTNDVIVVIACLALVALAESVLAQRERERHAAALERTLLRAELSNLRLQLQPHFLFNALNTISSTMYDDVAAADAQLGQLAELLRTSLRTTHTHEVPARDELWLLDQYLSLMTARFGDRLTVTVTAPDDVLDLRVPSMILQPLVENAVRHGGVTRVGYGCVDVTLRRDGDVLELCVRDSVRHSRGSGNPPHASPLAPSEEQRRWIPASAGMTATVQAPESRVPSPAPAKGGARHPYAGTGLSATERRLRLLYGDAQSMRAGPIDGGWDVTLRIPART